MSAEAARRMGRVVDYAELMLEDEATECARRIRATGDPVAEALALAQTVGFLLENSAARQGLPTADVVKGFRLDVMENLGEPSSNDEGNAE